MNRFLFRKIWRDDPLMTEVYQLRYKVYCEEWGFEKPEDHPGGLERDEYDARAVHFGALAADSGELIGTIRIILNSELGFPIERHCVFDADLSFVDKNRIAEISRLAVSKDFRRRAVDQLIYSDGRCHEEILEQSRLNKERRKHEFYIIMGLYICMYQESLALGLTHWYGLMARGLHILLRRSSIHFQPIGPEINHHGRRVPYIGDIAELARALSDGRADFFAEYEEAIVSG
jgi:N-acyl amino acid synthase of PEP-CTERM/exosortase system